MCTLEALRGNKNCISFLSNLMIWCFLFLDAWDFHCWVTIFACFIAVSSYGSPRSNFFVVKEEFQQPYNYGKCYHPTLPGDFWATERLVLRASLSKTCKTLVLTFFSSTSPVLHHYASCTNEHLSLLSTDTGTCPSAIYNLCSQHWQKYCYTHGFVRSLASPNKVDFKVL